MSIQECHYIVEDLSCIVAFSQWHNYWPFLCSSLGVYKDEEYAQVKAIVDKDDEKQHTLHFIGTENNHVNYVNFYYTVKREERKIYISWTRKREYGYSSKDSLLS